MSICPVCGKGQGPEIPDQPGKHYSEIVLVEIRGIYDGGLFYLCPFCKHMWHRWPEGNRLRNKADAIMQEWREAAAQ